MLVRTVDRGYQQFGPFLIVRTLGRGGMGEVFVARTPWSENPVAAVKRLRPDVARVATFAERFQHESELAVRLEHQNVVGTLDVGSVNGQLYVASQLVLGKDTGIIADRLRERGQGGPAAVAIRLMLDILAGLAYVHEARDLDGTPLELVHRDITPGNVLVSYDGVAQLADFGLAKSHLTQKANLTQHGEILGTPNYLAPEIIRGEAATVASDLYGLGAVTYRFLTGVAPHFGSTAEVLMKVLSEEPRSLSDLRPDLSPWLVTFVHRLLAKTPSERPSDARALVAELSAHAKAAGLLVPRSAVGRWLGDLFQSEKADELEEQDRLIAITDDDLKVPSEGTVVLAARPRSGSLFRAPGTDVSEHMGYEDSPGLGTDLDGGEPTDARPVPNQGAVQNGGAVSNGSGLGAVVPSDVTDAAQVAVLEMNELDGMPTRAVTMLPIQRFDEQSGTQEMIDRAGPSAVASSNTNDTDTQLPMPAVGSDEDDPTALPGFVDADDERPTYTAADTSLDQEQLVSRARPRDAGDVIVSPLAPSAVVRPVPDGVLQNERRDVRGHVGATAESPPGAAWAARSGPRGPAPARAAPLRAPPARNLLMLGSMMLVAVLLGVLVGAMVVSYREPQVTVVAPRGPLQEQLFRVQTRLVGRVERGEVVPAEVWSKVTRVHAALQAGDEPAAAALLRELEADR